MPIVHHSKNGHATNSKPQKQLTVAAALRLLIEPDSTFEIRLLDCHQGNRKPFTIAGYFDDVAAAAEAVKVAEQEFSPAGIYWTLNPVDPACLARSPNKLTAYLSPETSNRDVQRRRYLSLDFDPVRPAGVSATAAELKDADGVMRQAKEHLGKQGWPIPFSGHTGNGARLLYRIDLPNDDESEQLVKAVLESLADEFSTATVKLDIAMGNAARIDKVFGTWARKGCDTPERPHRQSKLLSWPTKPPQAVTAEQLIAVALPKLRQPSVSNGKMLDVANYLDRHGIRYRLVEKDDRRLWHIVCPFDPTHGSRSESSVIQFPSGLTIFKCQHDSCQGKGWSDLKTNLGEPLPNGHFGVSGVRDWGEVLAIETHPVDPFPVQALPPQLREWVSAVAESTQTPPDLAAMQSLSVYSTALAKTHQVRVTPDWIEPAHLWTCSIMLPSTRKTQVVEKARQPLDKFEKVTYESGRQKLIEARSKRDVLTGRIKSLKDQAAKAKADGDRSELVKEIVSLELEAAELNCVRPRLLIDDATPEKLVQVLAEQHGRIAIISDEAGIFDIIQGVYNRRVNLDIYLRGYSGGNYIEDRVSKGTTQIENVCITQGLCVQPEALAGIRMKGRLHGRGFLARYLYSVPKSLLGNRRIDPQPIPQKVEFNYAALVTKLCKAQAERWTPLPVELSADATALRKAFQQEIETLLTEGEMLEWLGKLVGNTLRIALILHQVKENSFNPIKRDTLDSAIAIGRYCISHAKAVFGVLTAAPEVDDARCLLGWIKKREAPQFSKREAQQSHKSRFTNVNQLDSALELLTRHNAIRPAVNSRTGPGRRSDLFQINPELLSQSQTPKTPISE